MTGDGEGGGGSRRRWRSLLHNEPATPPPLLIALSPRFLFRSDQLRSSFTATMMKNDGGLCIGPAVATIIRRSVQLSGGPCLGPAVLASIRRVSC
ncbi:hypothetical protein HanHA89_Chr06g0229381 [Helianthus annuus]|nr:hypothetical protein HanHA89_Chr06g0229381 [Helianthus annuus]